MDNLTKENYAKRVEEGYDLSPCRSCDKDVFPFQRNGERKDMGWPMKCIFCNPL